MFSILTLLTGGKGPNEDTIQNQIRKNKAMTKNELTEILQLHEMWLNEEEGGAQAKFEDLDLRGLDFRGANLIKADFKDADCSGVDFTGADLRCADFTGANLTGADFAGANLKWANFYKAHVTGARFNGAIIDCADFRWARGIVDLTGEKTETQSKRKTKKMNDNKIITTEDGEEINLSALEREFGSYDFEGHTYYAARQMELTNRLFAGCYNDAEEGEEYISEYSAPGYDENGNPVEIFMTFTQVKGEEIDPENLNWFQDSDRVEAL